jgi:hypothetical protein
MTGDEMIVVEFAIFGRFRIAIQPNRVIYIAQANGSASNAKMLTAIAIRFFLRNLASSLATTSGAIGASPAAGAGSGGQ